jgi:hypothetical protein
VRGNDTAAELLKTTSCSVTRMGVMEASALSQTPSVIDVPALTKGGTADRTGFSTTAVAASRGVLNLVMPQCSTRTLGPRMGHLPQLSGLLTVAPGSWANASAGTVLWSAAVLAPRDRLAAILVVVFAQQVEDITTLTWDRVTITADKATVDLAALPIDLPSPLDEPLRTLAASNYNGQAAAHPKSPWVFRGYRPGTHITSAYVLAALEARLGTLNELTQTTAIAILAETLGYHPRTLETHAKASGSTYARYIATRLD